QKMAGKKDTFIVEGTAFALDYLGRFTFWHLFNVDDPVNFGSVDRYVLRWWTASALAYAISFFLPPWVLLVLALVGILRVHEVVNFRARLLLQHKEFGRWFRSRRRSFLLLGWNVVEIVLWFSLFYCALRQSVYSTSSPSQWRLLFCARAWD